LENGRISTESRVELFSGKSKLRRAEKRAAKFPQLCKKPMPDRTNKRLNRKAQPAHILPQSSILTTGGALYGTPTD
jgi:hypothetical protein